MTEKYQSEQAASTLYELAQNKLFDGEELTQEEEKALLAEATELEERIMESERLRLKVGRVLDYNRLKKEGFTPEELKAFYEEDCAYVEKIDEHYRRNLERRDYMFGYPANMEDYSYATQYFRFVESRLYLMNNCGDPYQKGNYGMDSKSLEKRIISLIAESLGLRDNSFWGYITSGGTESNFWGIREGFSRFPDGKLYFSDATHYSVEKFVGNDSRQIYPYEKIPAEPNGAINVKLLLERIIADRKHGVRGVILVLTWGTTCSGAIDSVKEITEKLDELGIEYYCHLDAALYGGISKTQTNAPSVAPLAELGVDSISVSMHKFLGTARVNGVLLALTRTDRKIVDYIGQEDSTLLGSRDYLHFSTYQRVREMLSRKAPNHYEKNVLLFKSLLDARGIDYEEFENGNIFIVNKPSDEVCKKYQLATFKDAQGNEKAHVIIFPFHKREIIEELVRCL